MKFLGGDGNAVVDSEQARPRNPAYPARGALNRLGRNASFSGSRGFLTRFGIVVAPETKQWESTAGRNSSKDVGAERRVVCPQTEPEWSNGPFCPEMHLLRNYLNGRGRIVWSSEIVSSEAFGLRLLQAFELESWMKPSPCSIEPPGDMA